MSQRQPNHSDTASSPDADLNAAAEANAPPRNSRWQAFRFALKAIEIRLRFVAVLVGIGLLIGYWDTLRNYWDKWTRPAVTGTARVAAGEEFYCPMHPSVVRDTLEQDGSIPKCPICGMPLSKHKKGAPPELPPGIVARVQLSPERILMAGVETVPIGCRPLQKEVRTVGFVEYDESRLSQIVPRFNGYVEKLYVDKTFQAVHEGEPLADVYSPELYSAVQELLITHTGGDAKLIDACHAKLRLLGVSEPEIEEIHRQGKGEPRLTIRSPRTGRVIRKNVVDGSRIETGMMLFEVADLSVVWIEAEVYERDAEFLREGQPVTATVESLPGRTFEGAVSLIYPELNRATRTNRVRFELQNPDARLRPGMFATVSITVPVAELEPLHSLIASQQMPEGANDEELIAAQRHCPVTGLELGKMGTPLKQMVGAQPVFLCCKACVGKLDAAPEDFAAKVAPPPTDAVLAIPQQSVIDTGSRHVAFIEREPGVFEGVQVTLGPRTGAFYPVISGLLPGDRVATAGAFLIDAETRLNPAAASAYFGASGGPSDGKERPAPQRSDDSVPSPESSPQSPLASNSHSSLSAGMLREIAKLPAEDQPLARRQQTCPITGQPLGSMGVPVKLSLKGQSVFICCPGCEDRLKQNPEQYMESLKSPSIDQGAEQRH